MSLETALFLPLEMMLLRAPLLKRFENGRFQGFIDADRSQAKSNLLAGRESLRCLDLTSIRQLPRSHFQSSHQSKCFGNLFVRMMGMMVGKRFYIIATFFGVRIWFAAVRAHDESTTTLMT